MKKIKLVVFDVDGVLTDGSLFYLEDSAEAKSFHSRDGLGIRILLDLGFIVAFITGRQSKVVKKRAQELGVIEVHQNIKNKLEILESLLFKYKLSFENVAFAGDDLIDLACMKKVALALAPQEAAPEVIAVAHFVSSYKGGKGAARQMIEFIIKKQGRWNEVLKNFLNFSNAE